MRDLFRTLLLVLAGAALLAAACANSMGASNDGAMPDGGVPSDDEASFRDSACAAHCSSDLHSVLDCNGSVVTTCADDEGCAAGACVKACDSADANKSTVGCDYFTFSPDMIEPGGCFAAYVVNTWGSPVTITVDRGGESLPVSNFARIPNGSGASMTYGALPGGQLPAGQVAIVFLAGGPSSQTGANGGIPGCPGGVTPATAAGDFANGTGRGTALHVATDRPVVAYDIWPYGGGDSAVTSATLLLPTASWDTNYVAVDGYDTYYYPSHDVQNVTIHPWIAVVASQDGTDVTLSPTSDLLAGSGGIAASPKGTPQTYSLKRGEVITFLQSDELVGTPIQSTKPVGVWGGMDCMDVPDGVQACDSAHQQIPPVRALGHEYAVARYRDRYGKPEWPPVRMVGAVDKTTLTYDPAPPTDAPSSIDKGQMVEFRATKPFVVRSQDDGHPFYVATYMTGCSGASPDGLAGATDDCRGDPEFVNVIPPGEYLSQYTFFTDPTYSETELVAIREMVNGSFSDVSLDCVGTVSGWQPLDTAGTYQVARIDLVTGNFAKVGSCDNGRHEMHSAAPFGLTVWGWGSAATGGTYGDPTQPGFYTQAVSYAYPAGASVQQITSVVVPVN